MILGSNSKENKYVFTIFGNELNFSFGFLQILIIFFYQIKKIKDQYNLFGKLIWPASAADGLRGRQTVEEAPLTNLWLQFARWRLWINGTDLNLENFFEILFFF